MVTSATASFEPRMMHLELLVQPRVRKVRAKEAKDRRGMRE